MRIATVIAAGVAVLIGGAGQPVQAQTINVGDEAGCDGHMGQIVGTQERPGWDEPFVIVSVPGAVPYEIKCVPSDMILTGRPAAPSQNLCELGSRVEAIQGTTWYEATVIGPANESGWCLVHFEGYAPLYDAYVAELRPLGGGPVYRPERPWEEPVEVTPPDGTYDCAKISLGSGLFPAGTMEVNGGQVSIIGLPDGAAVLSVKLLGGTGLNGNSMYAVEYQNANGSTDRLDCQ